MSTFQFGVGDVFATQTIDASGVAVALPQPIKLGTLQEIALDFSFEAKELYGAFQFPVAVGRGKGKASAKAKVASIDGRVFSDLIFGRTATAGIDSIQPEDIKTIAATVTVAPPATGVFKRDLGVRFTATGVELVRVATAPAAGQYAVNETTGAYTFNTADVTAGGQVSIAYEWTKSTGGQIIQIKNELMGVSPFFSLDLRTAYQGKELVLHLNRVTASKLGMGFKNDDFVVPDLEFNIMADDSQSLGYWSLR